MSTKSFALIAAAALMSLALGACDSKTAEEAPAAPVAAVAVSLPTDPNDAAAWKKYLADVVMKNMQGVKSTRPYMYFVPAGADAELDRSNQLDNVQTVISRGVLPGNMLAFGGPDSTITANLVVDAFADGQANTFKDVVVLFVGAEADRARVEAAVATVGATYRFAEMK